MAANCTFKTRSDTTEITIFHVIKSIGYLLTDNFTLIDTPADNVIPTVNFMSPENGSELSGTNRIQINATDNLGVAKVTLAVDGKALKSLNVPPYEWTLDTNQYENGSHTLSATAIDVVGNTAECSTQISTSNPTSTTEKGIPNSSVEQVSNNPLFPVYWKTGNWGANRTEFAYLDTGYNSDHSVQAKITSYTSGDAKWYFKPQDVTAGKSYRFTDYYKSDVTTSVVVALVNSTGTTSYVRLKNAPPASSWTKYSDAIIVPSGIVKASVYHLISSVGTLTTDEFTFQQIATEFSQPLVSIAFDDGYSTDYTEALPALRKYGLVSTNYIISECVDSTESGYMDSNQINQLKSYGNEIGSHTIDHPYLTELSNAEISTELSESKDDLAGLFGTINNFAIPYGDYNENVIAQIKNHYRSARTSDAGYNSLGSFDPYHIRVQHVDAGVTPETVNSWVTDAKNNKWWLVILFHKIDNSGDTYTTTPEYLDRMFANIKNSGVRSTTINQALDELSPQVASN
jgi:peptidoglycan/xylan/chitin deacetylase (PgdA/CDA1 family)